MLLLAVLWWCRPRDLSPAEAARLLPDVVGLVGRLARDTSVPTRVRIYLWLLVAYLALPIDIVPDFIPVIGYADDAIFVALVLRAVVRASGAELVMRHWRGSAAGRDAGGRHHPRGD